MNFGAIDIGSNAIRLLIMSADDYLGQSEFKKLAFIRVPIRLGEDVFSKGEISQNKIERLNNAIQGFAHIMKSFDVKHYKAYATSAMREASNGSKVVDDIDKKSGIRIEVISGIKEADTVFASGADQTLDPNKNYLYVDVGGGSTEIVVYSSGCQKVEARSFTLGTVRILTGNVDEDEMKKLKKWLKEVSKKYAIHAIVGSGGNINKIQRILGKKEKESVTFTELKVLYDYISSFDLEDRIHILKLNTYRADVIVPAMKIFLTVAKASKTDEIIVPRAGLADGIIHTLYEKNKM